MGNVKYKGTERNVLLRGDYRYFRTWSGKKTWVRLKGVDADEVQQEEESSDEAKHYSAWKSFRYQIDLYT